MLVIDPADYAQQFLLKQQTLVAKLQSLKMPLPELESFESPPRHYRLRAEFKMWHQGDQCRYAMTNPGTKQPILLDQFDVASETINHLMPKLLVCIHANFLLRQRLFQVEFLSTLSGDTLITLIYHKPLDETWKRAASVCQDKLGVSIIGRSRKQKIVLDKDFVTETLSVNGSDIHYRQIEGGFTQPNGKVCQKMLTWAQHQCEGLQQRQNLRGDLLELYCGNGNFTVALAGCFDKVLATEISKTSVHAAQHNFQINGINNVRVVRMSSEEVAQALAKVREFRRLKDIDLDSYQFSTVFVDPPRAGLDPATLEIIQGFENILYISCNPDTLIDNVSTLKSAYQIRACAWFDQFPYTSHAEIGLFLSKP